MFSNKKQLIEIVKQAVISNTSVEFIKQLSKNQVATQNVAVIMKSHVQKILDDLKLSYSEADNQHSKDFRNVGSDCINFNLEIKKTDSKRIMCNDTRPNKDTEYLIFFTGIPSSKWFKYPKIVWINGGNLVVESPWLDDYFSEIEKLRDMFDRGNLVRCRDPSDPYDPSDPSHIGNAYVYTRPNLSIDISNFIYDENVKQAINKYELFHNLEPDTATFQSVHNSSAGIEGWYNS